MQANHSTTVNHNDDDCTGITTADAIGRLQKLTNVANFEQKYDYANTVE